MGLNAAGIKEAFGDERMSFDLNRGDYSGTHICQNSMKYAFHCM